MTTRTITGTLHDALGNPLDDAPVTFTADRPIYTTDPDVTYLGGATKAVTNALGVFTVDLTSGLPFLWNVDLPNGERFPIAVADGAATTLEALRAEYSGGPPALPLGSHPYQGVFNVLDYQAVGDGVTNDHTAVAAAITAANAAGGGIVYFPKGTYIVNGSLGGTATNITIKGDGRFISTIKKANSTGTHIFDITGNQWHFEDIGIDGNRANNSQGHGVRIAGDYHTMDRVYIHDTVGYGIANAQTDGNALRYCHYNDVILYQTGTDSIDIKDQAQLNVGNRLTNIVVLDWDQSATGACAAIDCRGPVELLNITCKGNASTNGSAVRFRETSPTTGPVGGRRCTLTNALIVGNGSTSSYGVTANANDISISNVVIVDCWRGVVDTAATERLAVSNVTVINGFSRGFEINSDEGTSLVNCRAEGCVVGFRIAGDDVTLTNCRTDDASNTGFQLIGARPILIGCRPKATGGTGVSVDAAVSDARIIACDLTGQSGGTKVSNSGTGTVFRDNIAYVTRSAGVTSVADGGTISHGLVTTPTKYGATTTTADEYLAITAVSSTTLTVALTKHDGTVGTTANVAWWAEL